MNTPPAFDEIPVLTEVVAETVAETADDPADDPADDGVDIVAGVAETLPRFDSVPEHAQQMDAPRELDDDAWRVLEERLVARVLDRLQDRIELVLEDQLRIGMAPILDHVVARLAVDLRAGLQQTVEQVVTRAVAQELQHLKRRQ
jgi:hypothetical protein